MVDPGTHLVIAYGRVYIRHVSLSDTYSDGLFTVTARNLPQAKRFEDEADAFKWAERLRESEPRKDIRVLRLTVEVVE